jgi:hypothetical protein
MKSTPLIMSGPMIRAYMEGRKCVTGRTKGLDVLNGIKPHYDGKCYGPDDWEYQGQDVLEDHCFENKITGDIITIASPFGGAGDELWFRETWAHCQPILDIKKPDGRLITEISDGYAEYRADGHDTIQDLKDHVRLTAGHEIVVKGNRWIAAIHMFRWASRFDHVSIVSVRPERLNEITGEDAVKEGFESAYKFNSYWDKLNSKKGLAHYVNPWVWRIEFEPYKSK